MRKPCYQKPKNWIQRVTGNFKVPTTCKFLWKDRQAQDVRVSVLGSTRTQKPDDAMIYIRWFIYSGNGCN